MTSCCKGQRWVIEKKYFVVPGTRDLLFRRELIPCPTCNPDGRLGEKDDD